MSNPAASGSLRAATAPVYAGQQAGRHLKVTACREGAQRSRFSPCSCRWCNVSLCASGPWVFLSSHHGEEHPRGQSPPELFPFSPPAISCPPPPAIADGKHNGNGTEEFMYSSVVMYMCDPGLQLVGNETLHCTTEDGINGVWSGSPPKCKGERCWIIIPFSKFFLLCS